MKLLLVLCFLQAPILKPPPGALAPEHLAPANLDFEAAETGGTPAAWDLAQESRVQGYTAEVRREGCRSGKGCAAIVAGPQVDSDGTGTIFQQLSAEAYRGRKVRFHAWVKLESAKKDAHIRIAFAADTEDRVNTFTQKNAVRANQWTLTEIEGKVPAKADQIHLLITLSGRGTALIDDATFEPQ